MILYDEKLNFLGMSEHTLSFLGYEDIADFTSMQSDVADLFVKKEGYIYKFDNFSWIDFILYSGSATKAAIIRLKNGQETNIDITIKEIFLSDSINGNKKLYSVKLISDNFHKISGVAKETPAMGGFSLNHLLNTDDTKKTVDTKPIETQNSKKFILDDKKETTNIQKVEDTQINTLDFLNNKSEEPIISQEQESSNTDNSFKINFLSDNNKPKIDINTPPAIESIDLKQETKIDDNISLNFLKTENTTSDEDNIPDIKPIDNVQENQKQTDKKLKLNFLKNAESITQEDITEQTPPIVEKTDKKESSDFPLNFLKTNSEESKSALKEKEKQIEDTSTPKLKLNFLKSEEVVEESKDKFETLENEDKEIKLNFSKVNTQENIKTTIPKDEPETKLNFLKNDTAELDTKVQKDSIDEGIGTDKDIKLNVSNTTKEEAPTVQNDISLNFLKNNDDSSKTKVDKSSSDENKLNFLNIKTPTETQEEENSEKDMEISKSQIIKQIKEDIKEIDEGSEKVSDKNLFEKENKKINFDKSDLDIQHMDRASTNNTFVDTLKGLFNEPKEIKQIDKSISSDNSDKVFSFKLKQHNEPIQEVKKIDPIETIVTTKEKAEIETSSYPSLKSLGLDPSQEKDLLSDFIADSKESINAIRYFIEINDFDKIKYSIVKIKSSAEILSLDDIIRVSNTMKSNCESSNLEQIIKNQEILSQKVEQLEQHLSKIIV